MTLVRSEFVSRKITDLASGQQWLRDLVALNLMFHLEDDAADIGTRVNGEWVNLFTAAEAEEITKRQEELYALTWPKEYDCPIGFMMAVEEETNGKNDA